MIYKVIYKVSTNNSQTQSKTELMRPTDLLTELFISYQDIQSPSPQPKSKRQYNIVTRCTRGVRVVFSVTRMRSSNSARMNIFDFTTEKIGSVHMIVFEIVAHRNVDNWIQLLT